MRVERLQPNEETVLKLGELIEKQLQFTNRGTGITTLAEQVRGKLNTNSNISTDSSIDCKLPPLVMGFAIKSLYESMGISKKIYFGLGTPVHPHVVIEVERTDGEPEYLDINFNNIDPTVKHKSFIPNSVTSTTPINKVEEIITESSTDTPFVITRRKVDINRRDRRLSTKSYMHVYHIDKGQMRTRLENPRYDFHKITEIENIDFLRLLDSNFLRESNH